MKRILALLAVLAVLLTLPGANASAPGSGDGDRTVLLDSDGRFLAPSRYSGQLGYETPDQEGHFALRLLAFARAYGCDVYAGCMESPSRMDPAAASFAAYRDRFLSEHPEAQGSGAVCLLYDGESNSAFVHVGASVAEGCDTSSVEKALRNQKETDSYFRMVHALDALQKAVGQKKSLLITDSGGSDYNRLQKSLAPLREVFSGPVFLQYGKGDIRSDYDAYNTYSGTPSYYPDSIIIYYDSRTGEALVQLGEDVKLRLADAGEVEAAFLPSRSPRDYSGFSSGVQALADHLLPGREAPAYTGPVLLATALAVFVLALAVEAAARRRGDPILPREEEKQG